jgi:hypothetical protein
LSSRDIAMGGRVKSTFFRVTEDTGARNAC